MQVRKSTHRRLGIRIVVSSPYWQYLTVEDAVNHLSLAPLWINGSSVNLSDRAGLLTWIAMKPRHAAALALVGWYLMMPLKDHPEAPIKYWSQIGSYDSAKECEAERERK